MENSSSVIGKNLVEASTNLGIKFEALKNLEKD